MQEDGSAGDCQGSGLGHLRADGEAIGGLRRFRPLMLPARAGRWSQVEMHRAPDEFTRELAATFVGWGIPTAESIFNVKRPCRI